MRFFALLGVLINYKMSILFLVHHISCGFHGLYQCSAIYRGSHQKKRKDDSIGLVANVHPSPMHIRRTTPNNYLELRWYPLG